MRGSIKSWLRFLVRGCLCGHAFLYDLLIGGICLLITCAYDNNGTLLKATTKVVSINAKTSTGDISMGTVEGAEQYKVFLWDGLNTMKPLMN